MPGWTLAIDFGTSATAAAVAEHSGKPRLITFRNGSATMPSAVVHQDDGTFLTGALAVNQRMVSPECFEPTPKRHLGEESIFLGVELPTVSVVAAVLDAAARAARRQFDDTVPARVLLTHPADWQRSRLGALEQAAAQAGLGEVELVPEPAAAACFYADDSGDGLGGAAAIYDLGGGTFDAAVVTFEAGRFAVRSADGLDYVGGVAFDRKLFDIVGKQLTESRPDAWAALSRPQSRADRQARLLLDEDIRSVKETLSERQQWKLPVPRVDAELLITRDEFEAAIRDDVDVSVGVLEEVVRAARLPQQLAALYLVGGSSTIPLVHETVWKRLAMRPNTRHDPKAVVALGAAVWPGRTAMRDSPPTTPRPAQDRYVSRLMLPDLLHNAPRLGLAPVRGARWSAEGGMVLTRHDRPGLSAKITEWFQPVLAPGRDLAQVIVEGLRAKGAVVVEAGRRPMFGEGGFAAQLRMPDGRGRGILVHQTAGHTVSVEMDRAGHDDERMTSDLLAGITARGNIDAQTPGWVWLRVAPMLPSGWHVSEEHLLGTLADKSAALLQECTFAWTAQSAQPAQESPESAAKRVFAQQRDDGVLTAIAAHGNKAVFGRPGYGITLRQPGRVAHHEFCSGEGGAYQAHTTVMVPAHRSTQERRYADAVRRAVATVGLFWLADAEHIASRRSAATGQGRS